MKNILYISNIPTKYRVEFLNALSSYYNVTAIFEARFSDMSGLKYDFNDSGNAFKTIFLREGCIEEKRINFRILKYLTKKYDHILVTNYAYFTELVAIIFLIIAKKKFTISLDGIISKNENIIKGCIKKIIFTSASIIFSPSRETDKIIKEYTKDISKIKRYPFSSVTNKDIENMESLDKTTCKIEVGCTDSTMLLYVGQFIKRKGVDDLLDAFKRLQYKFSNKKLELYLVGNKNSSDMEYYNLISKNINNNIHIKDYMELEHLQKYYKAADFFVFPTHYDVWGLVINEAFSAGIPVVCSSSCGAGIDLIENNKNGLLYEDREEDALYDACCNMIKNEESWSKMGYYNKIKISTYTIEKMASAYYQILG